MRFARPELLVLLSIVPIWAVGLWAGSVRRQRALERFAGGRANVAPFIADEVNLTIDIKAIDME